MLIFLLDMTAVMKTVFTITERIITAEKRTSQTRLEDSPPDEEDALS